MGELVHGCLPQTEFSSYLQTLSSFVPGPEVHPTPTIRVTFCGERFGFGKGSPKPVVNLTSLKGWHQEFIFIKGGDLAFTPIFSKTITIRSPEVPVLEGPALTKVQNFCKGLGEGLQLTRDSLMKNGFLLGLGCKS